MESYVVRIYRRSVDCAEIIGVVQLIEKNTHRHFHSLTELMQLIEGGVLSSAPIKAKKARSWQPK